MIERGPEQSVCGQQWKLSEEAVGCHRREDLHFQQKGIPDELRLWDYEMFCGRITEVL